MNIIPDWRSHMDKNDYYFYFIVGVAAIGIIALIAVSVYVIINQ